MSHDHDDDLIGRIREKTGWLTGDREAEAEGRLRRVRAAFGVRHADGEEVSDEEVSGAEVAEAVEEAERDLRRSYGEHDPEVDDRPTAPDERPVDG